MSKVIVVLVSLPLVLAAAGAGAYFALLSPPDAQEVCDNLVRITKESATKKASVKMPDGAFEQVKTECVKSASKAPEFGRYPWVNSLKCIRDAKTDAELDACRTKK